MRHIRRFDLLTASALASVLALGVTACNLDDEELDLSDDELLLSESCTRDDGRADDARLACVPTTRGEWVRIARDVRADDADTCARLEASDIIFERFARRCVVTRRLSEPEPTCDTVLCAEGTVCRESERGYPVCVEQPERECDRDDFCSRACIERRCAELPQRRPMQANENDGRRAHRDRGERLERPDRDDGTRRHRHRDAERQLRRHR